MLGNTNRLEIIMNQPRLRFIYLGDHGLRHICRSPIQQKAKTCQQARGQGAVDNTPSLHKPQRPAQPQQPKEPANPPTTRSQSQKEKSPQKLD